MTVGVDPESVKGIRLRLGEGIAGTVAQTGRPIFIPNVDQDPRFSARVDTATGFDTRSIIALPLLVRGEVIGVFEVINVEDQKFFREKYLPHLTILADYVAIAVDNVRNLQKLQARTYIDEVTGFYNTRYLSLALDHLIPRIHQQGGQFSVVFLDLDNFKAVVDGHGHLRGSKVLGEVARVIHSVLGPDDSLVRYGGDEFLILLPQRGQVPGPGADPAPAGEAQPDQLLDRTRGWTSGSPPATASPPCRRTPGTGRNCWPWPTRPCFAARAGARTASCWAGS